MGRIDGGIVKSATNPKLAPTRPSVLPVVWSVPVQVRGQTWRMNGSFDLAQACLQDRALSPDLESALAPALAAVGQAQWRTTVDVAGVILSVAVDESTRQLAIGSPRFAVEAALVALCPEDSPSYTRLCELVAAWDHASADAAPLLLQTLVAHHGLPDLLQASGQWRDSYSQLLMNTRKRAAVVARAIARYRPSKLEQMSQIGLDWVANYAILRVHALRFVAALPSLDHDTDGIEVRKLLDETLERIVADSQIARAANWQGDRQALPGWLEQAVTAQRAVLAWFSPATVARMARTAVQTMARIFIAGEDIERAGPALQALADSDRDATLDQLGELVVSEPEADRYLQGVLRLVQGLTARYPRATRNSAGIPRGHVSVKVSALSSDYNADDVEGTWQRVGPRLLQILRTAKQGGVFIHLDAEHYDVRDLTLAMLEHSLAQPDLQTWADVGIVVQAYLRDAPEHLAQVLDLARRRQVRMPVRLVKGAYWDAETTDALAHDHLPPQFLNKAETDGCFQMLALQILAQTEYAQLCIGSHNLRDHCFAHEARLLLYPEAPPVEHQCLHMTYEGLSTGLAAQRDEHGNPWAVRNYIPVGSLLVGMAYLVRRILENSSQVGVLTMARAGHDTDIALQPPAVVLSQEPVVRDDLVQADDRGDLPPFRNVAPIRLDRPAHRAAWQRALAARTLLERFQQGNQAITNPSAPDEVIGRIDFAENSAVDAVVASAVAAGRDWAGRPVGHRAGLLLRAAELLRVRRPDFAALVCLEAGKARLEALGDVDEAIDFLQFYAREAVRCEGTGERQARGVIAVVAPWNFPLAIPSGMAAAALVSGNCVVLKPAEQTPLIARAWVDLMHEVGVPAAALQHLPGEGLEVGAPLVGHPDVQGVVFTGSMAVGLQLHRQMAVQGKLAIAEMGGKNAILVTANADLDEAVSGSLKSAFGHAGQKCSAASRILVDLRIFPQFVERFSSAAKDLRLGTAEAPGTRVNPVICRQDQERLRHAAQQARQEAERVGGRVWLDRSQETAPGHAVGPVVIALPAEAARQPQSWAQQELFGPIVHVISVADLEQALELQSTSSYALTGGIFAQCQADVDKVLTRMQAGNVYVNRPITGARVGVEPFGGFLRSGTGPKAGGRDYVLAMTTPATMIPNIVPVWNRIGDVSDHHDHADHPHDAAPSASWPKPLSPSLALRLGSAVLHAWTQPTAALSLEARLALQVAHQGLELLPILAIRQDAVRVIPGQDSYDRGNLARGPVLALATAAEPQPSTLAHVLLAISAGCPVRILAQGLALPRWQRLAELADADQQLLVISSEQGLPWLQDAAVTTVLLDGPHAAFADVLQALVEVQDAQPHLRAIHASQACVTARELVLAHVHVRSIAIHTMRHGASLSL